MKCDFQTQLGVFKSTLRCFTTESKSIRESNLSFNFIINVESTQLTQAKACRKALNQLKTLSTH